ncbi:MFS transporter [Kineosporia babensis]|nr:MFS transporter [Kineosporia babensis]
MSGGLLAVLCGAIFLEGIDVAMLNVALPAIRADLGLSTGTLSVVMSAYVVGYGGFMLLGGRAADLFGRRRMFLAWLGVFLVFSGLGGLATESWMLLTARFVTGVAAAFMTPAGLSIITTSFAEGPQRHRALLFYSGTAAAGFSLGLVAGGLLTAIHWRWVFFAPVLLSLVILLAALRLIPAGTETRAPEQHLDATGAAAITAAMMLLVLTLVRLEHPGEGWGWTLASFVTGSALLAAFVRIQRRATAPLVRLGILKSAALRRANLGAALFAGAFFGFQFLVVLYLQELRGWSTLETGLAMLLIGIDAVLAPTLTPWLVNRFGTAPVILGGTVLATAAYLLFLPVGPDWAYSAMLPSFVVLGLAFALAYGPLTIAATDSVDAGEQGLAGGLLNTSFQFGAAFGLSAAAAAYTAGDELSTALLVPVAMAALASVITAQGLRRN